jgi:crossover junction endodeoxyribonuclease RusA
VSATQVICVLAPVRIESEANRREHWRTVAKRKATHRLQSLVALQMTRAVVWPPCTITLTRIAPRDLDDDNLASGFKAFRDGVADWLGIDDGDNRLTWRYAQRRGKPKEYAAEVKIESEFK